MKNYLDVSINMRRYKKKSEYIFGVAEQIMDRFF